MHEALKSDFKISRETIVESRMISEDFSLPNSQLLGDGW